MALASGMGVRRNKGFPLRMKLSERQELRRRARAKDVSMSEYARCKIFDIPFSLVGGKNPKGRPKAAVAETLKTAEPTTS